MMESNSYSDKGGYKKRLAQDKDISEEAGDDGSSESESSENCSENDDSYGSSAHDNEGYQGEPPAQQISSRDQTQGEFFGNGEYVSNQLSSQMQHIGQQDVGKTSIEMQPMRQHDAMGPPFSMVQGNVPCVMQPGQYGHHQANCVKMNGPGNQYMVRDSQSPMPSDKENDGPIYTPSIHGIIFKRIISGFFILLDLCLNWLQYASWLGNFELPDWLNFLETANSLKGNSPWKSQCSKGSTNFTQIFGIIVYVGTAYGLLRIVSMTGETLMEYRKQKPSETGTGCRGFQLLHGWVETLLSLLCDDLPQAILLLLFSYQCHVDYTAMGKMIVWTIIKAIKNNVRNSTCKQKYKPFCNGCDTNACCSDFCDCCKEPCCNDCCKEPCCSDCCECCKEPCCQIECDFTCKRENGCAGEIVKDPDWALKLFEKLQSLYMLLVIAIVVISVLKENNIMGSYKEL